VVPKYEGGDSSNSAMAVDVPQSVLEAGTRQAQATVSVPLDNSTTARDSYLHMASISMPSGFSDDSLQANPLIVYFSRLPCFSSTTACDIEFTLPNVKPRSPYLLKNGVNINETGSAQCQNGVRSETFFTCSNGYVLNFTCSGDFAGVIRRRCPTMRYNSSCILLDNRLAAEGGGGAQCRAVAQSESYTVCKCPVVATSSPIAGTRRLQSSNYTMQGAHSIAVSTLLVSIASGMKSTIISAKDLNSDVFGKDVTVFVTMLVLAVLIVFFIGISQHLDYEDELSDKESIVVDETLSIKPIPMLRTNAQRRLVRTVTNREFAMIEESLPSIFSSQKFAVKLTNEMKQNHKWFGVIFHRSKVYPRVLRAIALCTNIIVMLFVQSVTYNLTNPDDGFCEMLASQQACQEPKSSFGTGGNKCLWMQQQGSMSEEGSCHFIQPSTDLTVILFVACFSALVSTPISLALNWLIFNVLVAPTSKPSNQQDETNKNQEKIATAIEHDQDKKSKTAEELEQLSKALQSYRALLGTTQRDEFDSKNL
jgi:hypothetical protein